MDYKSDSESDYSDCEIDTGRITKRYLSEEACDKERGNVEICINRADDVAMSNEMILEKVKQIMKKNNRKNKKLFEDVKVLSVDRVNSYKCIRELYIANKQLEWIDAVDSKEEDFKFDMKLFQPHELPAEQPPPFSVVALEMNVPHSGFTTWNTDLNKDESYEMKLHTQYITNKGCSAIDVSGLPNQLLYDAIGEEIFTEEGSCLQAPSHIVCTEKPHLIKSLFDKAYPSINKYGTILCEQVTITRVPVNKITLEGRQGPFTCWLYGLDDRVYCLNDRLPKIRKSHSFLVDYTHIWSFIEMVLAFACWFVGIVMGLKVHALAHPFFFTGWVCLEMSYLHYCGYGYQYVYAYICMIFINNGYICQFYYMRDMDMFSYLGWGVFFDACFLIVSILRITRPWVILIQALRQSLFLFWIWFVYFTSFAADNVFVGQYIHENFFRMLAWYLLLVVMVYIVISSLICFVVTTKQTDSPIFKQLAAREYSPLLYIGIVVSIFCLFHYQCFYCIGFRGTYISDMIIASSCTVAIATVFLINFIVDACCKWKFWVIASSSVMTIGYIYLLIIGDFDIFSKIFSFFFIATGIFSLLSVCSTLFEEPKDNKSKKNKTDV